MSSFYDQRWAEGKLKNRLKMARAAAILNELALCKLHEPQILDMGCGDAWFSSMLAHFGYVTGIELSPAAIDAAKNKYPHITFFASDFFTVPLAENSFDVIISQEVIEHVDNHEALFKRMAELLKPGGYLILTTPNPKTLYALPQKSAEQWSDQPIENYISVKMLYTFLKNTWKPMKMTSIILGIGQKGLHRWINSQWALRIVQFLGCSRLYDTWRSDRMTGLHILMVAKKQ